MNRYEIIETIQETIAITAIGLSVLCLLGIGVMAILIGLFKFVTVLGVLL